MKKGYVESFIDMREETELECRTCEFANQGYCTPAKTWAYKMSKMSCEEVKKQAKTDKLKEEGVI